MQDLIRAERKVESSSGKLVLPPAPLSERGEVKAWQEPVRMRTYAPAVPDKNPLFLEKRVYQGSSGKVYPLPVIDCIATKPEDREWQAVHIENEFIRLMILPEIGGRIHVGLDKRSDYDFFYRQNVIKPALVGLAGPWISGGVEFNWPQHHRPATFMPVEAFIERGEDGSVTVWCSDHDPLVRMKGMHGICLRPGQALVEVKVRLYNRTMDTQTFLWWANVATRVHEHYQSFFPSDVRFAADHAKRAVTEYPLSKSVYYGIDYAERGRAGVPEEEKPRCFQPEGLYPANDLGRYANIPVPTSYMIVGSRGDFFGGYDHLHGTGTVAVANHHISPGKKQWTWGNHEFGYAWDRNLTDGDGPYVELMSGVYTDNQPDFSFLAPGETKTFSQYWYPIAEIGVPNLANTEAALRIESRPEGMMAHVQVTRPITNSLILVQAAGKEVVRWSGDLKPNVPLHQELDTAGMIGPFVFLILEGDRTVLRYAPAEVVPMQAPDAATEPPLPGDVEGNDELFLTGLHLEQYHHPTRSAESYWREAVRRDEGDSRCNHALGRWHLRQGDFSKAEKFLRKAIGRLTLRNPNPYDGEPHYNLGLTLLYQERTAEAYDAFYKSTWNAGWRAPGYLRLAEIDCQRKEWQVAMDHVDRSLRAETDNLSARGLKALVLLRLNRNDEAAALLQESALLDPLDSFTRFLLNHPMPHDGQQRLDLGFDLLRSGFLEEALSIFSQDGSPNTGAASTLLLYARADVLARLGRDEESRNAYRQASLASPDYVFPSRLEELVLLQKAIQANPEDAHAPYFLGNLLYDRRRYTEAIALWERSTLLDGAYSVVWRNLGFAYQNVLHDTSRSVASFERAHALAPADARILYEYDQLLKRIGTPLHDRLQRLEAQKDLVNRRDDLSVEIASLYNGVGSPERALEILRGRKFQPWEGGEGLVLFEYVRANVQLAQRALEAGQPGKAIKLLLSASNPPENLSEAKHLLMNVSMIEYWTGVAYEAERDHESAREHWKRAARVKGDFRNMEIQEISDMSCWCAMALRRLGREEEAVALFHKIIDYACELDQQDPKIAYFATSLPAMLLFDEDLKARQTTTSLFMQAQGLLGLGEHDNAMQMLQEVQRRDQSHTGAIDLLRMLSGDACTDL